MILFTLFSIDDMPDEPFYTLHDDFDSTLPGRVRWRVCPKLVRSIERWCQDIYQFEAIDPQFITDRLRVKKHFDDWFVQVQAVQKLDRSTLLESFCKYLFTMLRSHPQNPTIQRHWIAFFMHRCVAVGWKMWRSTPLEMQSFSLFEEIITISYHQIGKFNEVNPILANFTPETSQLVGKLNHITAYLDRQIKYSILPDLRKILGEPNFGRTNLGVAARYSLSKIQQALVHSQLADIEEYQILWQCFSIYKREIGVSVYQMVSSDFQEIDRIYQIRSIHALDFLKGSDVKTRLEQIGKILRDSLLCKPLDLDANINEFQSLVDTIPSNSPDLLEDQISQAKWQVINLEIADICCGKHPPEKRPSHQQLFWLYYGLGLKQNQIGKILQANFQLNPNPGSVSLRLTNGRQYLFDRIHTVFENSPPALTKQEIDLTIGELLERYFESIICQQLSTLKAKLTDRTQLIDLMTKWVQEYLNLHIAENILKDTLKQIVDSHLDQPKSDPN
jgi:hypothetical protein